MHNVQDRLIITLSLKNVNEFSLLCGHLYTTDEHLEFLHKKLYILTKGAKNRENTKKIMQKMLDIAEIILYNTGVAKDSRWLRP